MPNHHDKQSIDWGALLERAEELDAPLTDEELSLWKRGLLDGNTRQWNVEYVHAVQRAVEGHDREELDAMLRAEIPIPSFLLPFLAMEPVGRRPAAFTALEDKIIREMFDRRRSVSMTKADVKRWIAETRWVTSEGGKKRPSIKTIERSLKRTDPATKTP